MSFILCTVRPFPIFIRRRSRRGKQEASSDKYNILSCFIANQICKSERVNAVLVLRCPASHLSGISSNLLSIRLRRPSNRLALSSYLSCFPTTATTTKHKCHDRMPLLLSNPSSLACQLEFVRRSTTSKKKVSDLFGETKDIDLTDLVG